MAAWLNANWEPLVSTPCWRAYVITTWQLKEVWNRIIIHSCPPFWNNDNENNLFLSPPRNRKTWRGTRILKQKIPGEKSDFSNSKAVYKLKHFPCKCIFSLVIIRSPVRRSSSQGSTHLQQVQHSAKQHLKSPDWAVSSEQQPPEHICNEQAVPGLQSPGVCYRLFLAFQGISRQTQQTPGTGQVRQARLQVWNSLST